NAYADRIRGERAANLEEAAGYLREACLATSPAAGLVALRTARGWARVALRQGRWDEAAEATRRGRASFEQLARANALRREGESWRGEVQGLAAMAAAALARQGDARAALLALETGQATALNDALGRGRDRQLLQRLEVESPARYTAYAAAADAVRATQAPGRDAPATPEETAGRQRRAVEAQAALDAAVAAVRALGGGFEALFTPPTFDDVAAAVPPGAPLAYLATTAAGSLLLLLWRGGAGVEVEALWAGLDEDALGRLQVRRAIEAGNIGDIVGGLLPAQVFGRGLGAELAAALPRIGADLMAPLAARLRELGATAVTLIPGGRLNLLPLHAARYAVDGQERAFLDEFAVTYAPSAQAAAESRDRAAGVVAGGGAALVVGNPMPLPAGLRPLHFAREEAEAVAELYGAPPLLATAATLAAVRRALPGARVFHFAGHGLFDPREPLDSGLVMANGERLTLRDVGDSEALAGMRLVVLSACQTGLTDFNDLPDEVIGLPAIFLQAGAAGVVGSLWPVDDRSTALLMTDFHRRMGAGAPPAEALRAAQLALRNMTRRQVSDYYMSHMRMPTEVASAAHAELPPGQDSDRIYAEPYYWAGFTYAGV
ncbi:MAG TPA: CHAT domain-containing protein, partial [Promineifilum sp.]|nr:CHAT domain-containing protein [Promineifilum sp.]